MPLNVSSCPIGFLVDDLHKLNNGVQHFNLTKFEHQLAANLGTSVLLALGLLVISCFLLFLGKALVKPTLFLAAFVVGTMASFLGLDAVLVSASVLSDMASCVTLMIAPLCIGILVGALAIFLINLGFALLGAAAGAGVGYTVYRLGLDKLKSPTVGSSNAIEIACFAVFALIGAVLLLKYQKSLLIVTTAGAGAAGAAPAIALLLAHANIKFLRAATPSSPSYTWVQPIMFACLFAVGVIVQCQLDKRTSRRKTNTTALRSSNVPLITP